MPRGKKRDGGPKKRLWMMPQEVEVWYILPAIRRELTRIMIELGTPQKDIAKILGITEPAVSQYKLRRDETSRARGDQIQIPEEFRPYLEEAAKKLLDAWKNRGEGEYVFEEMTREFNHLIALLRKKGVICEVHREHAEHVSDVCHACD